MDLRWFVKPDEKLPEKIKFPTPTMPREVQQEQFLRDLEIDPNFITRHMPIANRFRSGLESR
jgi:hypothetical protein